MISSSLQRGLRLGHMAVTARTLPRRTYCRGISTLQSNPNIVSSPYAPGTSNRMHWAVADPDCLQKVFPDSLESETSLLTYLESDPPNPKLAIGKTTSLPPTPRSFSANPAFMAILNDVLIRNAHNDEDLISQAKAFAGPGGATLGSGGAFFRQRTARANSPNLSGGGGAGGSGAGGATAQGGAGGAGRGGYVHLSDRRNPPDFGRIPWPEDILGSVEVDQDGNIIGQLQPSGTYRIVTNEGM